MTTVFIAKSTPMVLVYRSVKTPDLNLWTREVFPIPQSPITTILKRKSKDSSLELLLGSLDISLRRLLGYCNQRLIKIDIK